MKQRSSRPRKGNDDGETSAISGGGGPHKNDAVDGDHHRDIYGISDRERLRDIARNFCCLRVEQRKSDDAGTGARCFIYYRVISLK